MDLALMIDQAIDLEFPSVELCSCCLTYLAPCVVTAQGACAEAIAPNCSIAPGCGSADHCARVFLYRLLERVEGPGTLVLEQTKEVTCELVEGMPRMGLRFFPKSLLMMSNPKDEEQVQRHVLRVTGIKIKRSSWAKYLGIECSMGLKWASKTTECRVTLAQAQAARAAQFKRVGRGGKRAEGIMLRNANTKAKFKYADPVLGAPPSEVALRWRCVAGPMGALILMLWELGWTPRGSDVWIDDQGGEWRHMGDVADGYDELFKARRSSVRREFGVELDGTLQGIVWRMANALACADEGRGVAGPSFRLAAERAEWARGFPAHARALDGAGGAAKAVAAVWLADVPSFACPTSVSIVPLAGRHGGHRERFRGGAEAR
ncbi:unnamed protein product, partial [Prorocentrum cordatum]